MCCVVVVCCLGGVDVNALVAEAVVCVLWFGWVSEDFRLTRCPSTFTPIPYASSRRTANLFLSSPKYPDERQPSLQLLLLPTLPT